MKLTTARKLTAILTCTAIVALCGCASAPEHDAEEIDQPADGDDGNVGSIRQAAWSAPANTVPPKGVAVGFKMYKNFGGVWGIKNGQGRVGFHSSGVLATRLYTTATSERFAIYDMTDGTYNLCIPGTLVKKTEPTPYGTETYYEANCLYRGMGSHDLRFGPTTLSATDPGTTSPLYSFGGNIVVQLGPRTGYDYWVMRGEYMTNNSSNVVVGGSKSGHDNQIWQPF